jgi:hypothetical protein
MLVSSLSAIVFYTVKSFRFYKDHYKKGSWLVSILTAGYLAAIFLFIYLFFKARHFPGDGWIFLYIGFVLTLVMIAGTIKWKYDYNGKKINIFEGLSLFDTHIVPLYFAVFVFCFYGYLNSLGLAPDFYSERYPSHVKELYATSKEKDSRKANEINTAYFSLLQNCQDNGLIKY